MVRLIPPKTVCEEFSLVYELEGAQKAINFLSKYYGIKRMKIIVDGRRAGRNNLAYYLENNAYFTKNVLEKNSLLWVLLAATRQPPRASVAIPQPPARYCISEV